MGRAHPHWSCARAASSNRSLRPSRLAFPTRALCSARRTTVGRSDAKRTRRGGCHARSPRTSTVQPRLRERWASCRRDRIRASHCGGDSRRDGPSRTAVEGPICPKVPGPGTSRDTIHRLMEEGRSDGAPRDAAARPRLSLRMLVSGAMTCFRPWRPWPSSRPSRRRHRSRSC